MSKYGEWVVSLPKCLGYEGGCDGDLEGTDHEPNCPLFEKGFATLEDAFKAGQEVSRDKINNLTVYKMLNSEGRFVRIEDVLRTLREE